VLISYLIIVLPLSLLFHY